MSDTFTAAVTNGGASPAYQWTINSVAVAGATNATFISSELNNLDTVGCGVMSSGLCGGQSSFSSVVLNVYGVGVTATLKETQLRVLPNPNKGEFTVKGVLSNYNNDIVTVEITDMLGQVVYNERVSVKSDFINYEVKLGSTIANGMYLLNVRSGTENEVFHIVIEK